MADGGSSSLLAAAPLSSRCKFTIKYVISIVNKLLENLYQSSDSEPVVPEVPGAGRHTEVKSLLVPLQDFGL